MDLGANRTDAAVDVGLDAFEPRTGHLAGVLEGVFELAEIPLDLRDAARRQILGEDVAQADLRGVDGLEEPLLSAAVRLEELPLLLLGDLEGVGRALGRLLRVGPLLELRSEVVGSDVLDPRNLRPSDEARDLASLGRTQRADRRRVTIEHLMTHSSGLPAWVVIVDYAKNEAGDVGLRACCRMVVAVVGSKYSTIDFSLPAVQQILGGLVAGTLLTQGQADALAALSAKKKTLAETVLGVSPLAVTISDVAEIRRDS